MLGETAELELGHGLLVRTRVHGSGQDGEQEAEAGSLVRRAREVEEREKGEFLRERVRERKSLRKVNESGVILIFICGNY